MNGRWLLSIVTCIALSIGVLLPLMLPYAARKISGDITHYQHIFDTLPTITSHFFSISNSLVWTPLSSVGVSIPAYWDHQIFAGGIATLSLIGCVVFLMYRIFKVKMQFAKLSQNTLFLISGAFTFLLFLRFNDVSAYISLY